MTTVTEDDLTEAMRDVVDPELGINVVDLGLVYGVSVDEAMAVHQEFLTLMQSKGQGEPDEDVLEDAVAFQGVSKYPSRIKCALLGWMAWKDAVTRAAEGATT